MPLIVISCPFSKIEVASWTLQTTGIPNAKFVPLRLTALTQGISSSGLGKNVVALGALGNLFDIEKPVLEKLIQDRFQLKGSEMIEKNLRLLTAGYKEGENTDWDRRFHLQSAEGSKPTYMMLSGNEAVALGTIAAGLQYLGNPPNMGVCVACFTRDTVGALGLHRAAPVQYLRPEIPAFCLGAFLAANGFVVHDTDVPLGRESTWSGVEFLMVHHTGSPDSNTAASRLLGSLEFDDAPEFADWLRMRRDGAERERRRQHLAAARQQAALPPTRLEADAGEATPTLTPETPPGTQQLWYDDTGKESSD